MYRFSEGEVSSTVRRHAWQLSASFGALIESRSCSRSFGRFFSVSSTIVDVDMKEVESETKTCKRCKSSFAQQSNSSSACRFHPTYFVSRRHDDQKRYYDLGPDDPPYAAKFWDCCGSENPGAEGCKTSFHVSYDDDA